MAPEGGTSEEKKDRVARAVAHPMEPRDWNQLKPFNCLRIDLTGLYDTKNEMADSQQL